MTKYQQAPEDILESVFAGQPNAIDDLAARFDTTLAGFLNGIVGDHDLAQELLNEVWTELYLMRSNEAKVYHRDRASAEGWLLALAGRRAYQWLTRQTES